MIDNYFADQDFLSEVMKVADANHDGHISVSEAKALTSLEISRDIYSIAGLEYFEISGLSPVQGTTFRHIWICLALRILSVSVFRIVI